MTSQISQPIVQYNQKYMSPNFMSNQVYSTNVSGVQTPIQTPISLVQEQRINEGQVFAYNSEQISFGNHVSLQFL